MERKWFRNLQAGRESYHLALLVVSHKVGASLQEVPSLLFLALLPGADGDELLIMPVLGHEGGDGVVTPLWGMPPFHALLNNFLGKAEALGLKFSMHKNSAEMSWQTGKLNLKRTFRLHLNAEKNSDILRHFSLLWDI